MESKTHLDANGSNSFVLAFFVLFANIDVTGYVDYGIKAVLGGAVWLGFKLAAEYVQQRKNKGGNP